MAHPNAEISNELFEILEEWDSYLKHLNWTDKRVPPCP